MYHREAHKEAVATPMLGDPTAGHFGAAIGLSFGKTGRRRDGRRVESCSPNFASGNFPQRLPYCILRQEANLILIFIGLDGHRPLPGSRIHLGLLRQAGFSRFAAGCFNPICFFVFLLIA